MADMHFMYRWANRNSLEACRLYTPAFPNRWPPHYSTFIRLHQRLHESGTFKKRSLDTGRHREVRTPELGVAVNIIKAQPEASSKKITEKLNTDTSMNCMEEIKKKQLYPYHVQCSLTKRFRTENDCFLKIPQFLFKNSLRTKLVSQDMQFKTVITKI